MDDKCNLGIQCSGRMFGDKEFKRENKIGRCEGTSCEEFYF